ncbi:E3 ubiquitin-protein ligase SH3RF2 [Neosynchiropus ocellatus]
MKMEGLSLMALLECPLCLNQLDVSARVLPCQHTFCLSCLQKHQAAHSQLLCPECEAPVPARTVEELPENVLLVRLLDGMRGPAGSGRNPQTARYSAPAGGQPESQQLPVHSEVKRSPAGELAPAQSAVITQMQEADDDWNHRKLVAQLQPQRLALCKALCDFNPEQMNLEDGKCCLRFLKGDVLSLIRRVDEHWVEAKLEDKRGLCPLQFLELNLAAAKVLEGKSRRSDSAGLQQSSGSRSKETASEAPKRIEHSRVPQVSSKTPFINAFPLYYQWKKNQTSNLHHGTKGDASNVNNFNSFNRRGHTHRLSLPPAGRSHSFPSRVNSQRGRRHSDSHRRHLSQSEKKMTNSTPPNISMALLNPQMSSASADGKNASTQQLSISVCAVLYSYKPRRPEELELRKGEMVGVYGMFKEGWLRGLSLRTGKVGILPSNFITPVLRTSARLLETKAANMSPQHNMPAGKKPNTAKNPAVVLALDRVNSDGNTHSAGHIPPAPNGAQHAMPSAGSGKPSYYGGSHGWDTVRRLFTPQKASNFYNHSSNMNGPSNSQHFAQVQASGYSPAPQRKKNFSVLSNSGRPLGWMSESAAHPAGAAMKERDFGPHEAAYQRQRHPSGGPQSILVRPDAHKNSTDKPAKSVRFMTDEEPTPRPRTSSWSSGNQVHYNSHSGLPSLEVWAPSLTLGRDGPGINFKEGKAPIFRRGLETVLSDLNSNSQKPLSHPLLSAASAQFSPVRHRVATTHLAQTDSELSLVQGELVLVHRPRPDGRVLVTQESSGQTGLFHSNVLQALERLS